MTPSTSFAGHSTDMPRCVCRHAEERSPGRHLLARVPLFLVGREGQVRGVGIGGPRERLLAAGRLMTIKGGESNKSRVNGTRQEQVSTSGVEELLDIDPVDLPDVYRPAGVVHAHEVVSLVPIHAEKDTRDLR